MTFRPPTGRRPRGEFSELLAAAANESNSQYQQAQASYQTISGATVLEDKGKAQADVQVSQQVLDAAQKLYDNRVALQREGRERVGAGCAPEREVDLTRDRLKRLKEMLR